MTVVSYCCNALLGLRIKVLLWTEPHHSDYLAKDQ